MADYTPITNFTAKDSMATGDSRKLLTGSEWDAELAAIAVAIATKSNGTAAAAAERQATATWTPTWTGFSADPSGDLRYTIFGDGTRDIVMVSGTTLGTSNTTAFTITGIPAAIRPDDTVVVYATAAVNASIAVVSRVSITAAGAFTFSAHDSNDRFSASSWTASGNKGLFGYFMYPLIVSP